ncbi:heparanase isoform 2-T2 [Aulostomus maculatus]
MEALLLLFVFSVFCGQSAGDGGNSADVTSVSANVSRVQHRVDRRFLSATLDESLITDEKFTSLLSSPKVRTLARGLMPAYARFGGSKQDFMTFIPQHHQRMPSARLLVEETLPQWREMKLRKQLPVFMEALMVEEKQNKFKQVKFSELTVDQLYSFANSTGLDLIFGLNALLRTANNTWNSSNAQLLLRYCESRQYQMAWELGNEPNSYQKKAGIRLSGNQLAKDFLHLRDLMSQSKLYNNAGLFGPDVSQPRDRKTYILEGFLQSGSKAIDACTWHHYYIDGKNSSMEDFMNPKVLDTLVGKINEVLELVNETSPGKPVWLGETGSAYGGGAAGLSDSFVAGFMWMDKLGLAAKLGLNVVMRQTFIGSGSYHLLDDNMDPLPDYWLSLLYKRLVGPEVLAVQGFSIFSKRPKVRVYLHCTTRSYRSGAVTLMTMNMNRKPARISLPPPLSTSTVDAFVLESDAKGQKGLTSRLVMLNGDVLKMVDDQTLPPLRGKELPAAEILTLPAFSLGFYVFTGPKLAACQ